jgi:ABC-type sugar transport system permease subunit
MEVLLLLVLVGVSIVFYFLPSIIGYNKRNASAIFLLNLFLGWTLVGWVVALVWSVTYDPPPATYYHSA